MKEHKKVKGFMVIGYNRTFEQYKKRGHFRCDRCKKKIPNIFGRTLPESSCMLCSTPYDFAFYQEKKDLQIAYNKYINKEIK